MMHSMLAIANQREEDSCAEGAESPLVHKETLVSLPIQSET